MTALRLRSLDLASISTQRVTNECPARQIGSSIRDTTGSSGGAMQHTIFDWKNQVPDEPGRLDFQRHPRTVKLVDETLRDGLQNATGRAGPIRTKVDLLHAMVRVGVDVVSVGLPAAGARYAEDTHHLCCEIRDARLPLVATAAARTVVADVEGIVRASDRAGLPIEVYSFVGSSPIRIEVEDWAIDMLVERVRAAARAAVKHGLRFCLVTEDTTRSHPDVLRALFSAAVDEGASRLCLADTTGHITPYGVEELVDFTRRLLTEIGAVHVELDWHGHNDRGLALPTALWAVSAGVDRVHGTGLGVGERVGNASLELLVHNLGLLGARPVVARERLREYCELAARALAWEIPDDHPLAGSRAVRAGTGAEPYRAVPTETLMQRPETKGPRRDPLVPMTMRIGGEAVELAVHPRRTLLEALRYDLDLIGSKQGCDKGDCGACTVVVDGRAVLSCLTLALDADGCDVQTVETLGEASHLDPLVECFDRAGGGQCGFCTPGMLMSATALLDRRPKPTRDEIKVAISGNLCRCTGYGRIVDAIEMAAQIKRGAAPAAEPCFEHVPPPLPSNTKKPREEKR
ncbi:2-isopropylmalate synthase [Minicystis rosea]|nr:2-isopropylmalate synthase [Minicystis rosea]